MHDLVTRFPLERVVHWRNLKASVWLPIAVAALVDLALFLRAYAVGDMSL